MSDSNEMEPLKNKEPSEQSSSSGVSSERNSLKDVMMTNRDEIDDLRTSDKEKAQLIEPNCETVVRDNLAAASPAFGFGSIASLAQGQPGDHNPIDSESCSGWGWVIVFCAVVVMTPIAGTLASFGILYDQFQTDFNSTKLVTGWVSSLSFGFTVGMCPVSNVIIPMFGARVMGTLGVIAFSAGLLVSSFSPSVELLFLLYSTICGIGANFIYNTSMILTGDYFPTKHRSVATSMATCGISIGTLAINPLFAWMNKSLGLDWRMTWRIMSGVCFVVGMCCVATYKPAPQYKNNNTSKKDKEDQQVTESKMSLAAQEIKKSFSSNWTCSDVVNPGFLLWSFGTLLWAISFLFPHIFLADYMKEVELGGAATVMIVYGCSELGGRMILAFTAHFIPFSFSYVYGICTLLAGAVVFVTPRVVTMAMMYGYAVVAGVNAGVLNALLFVTTYNLFGDAKGKVAWGFINLTLAAGMMVGPIIAGFIFDTTGAYTTVYAVGAGLFVLCSVIMMAVKPVVDCVPMQTDPRKKKMRRAMMKEMELLDAIDEENQEKV